MSGPAPIPAGARARRNKSTTRGTLRVIRGEEAESRDVPRLPRVTKLVDKETGQTKAMRWHPRVQAWWQDLWQRSDITDELLAHEVSGALLRLARLYQRFWSEGDLSASSEIRLTEQRMGLEPMARRALQQEIDRGEEAVERTRARRNRRAAQPVDAGTDPRAALGE